MAHSSSVVIGTSSDLKYKYIVSYLYCWCSKGGVFEAVNFSTYDIDKILLIYIFLNRVVYLQSLQGKCCDINVTYAVS